MIFGMDALFDRVLIKVFEMDANRPTPKRPRMHEPPNGWPNYQDEARILELYADFPASLAGYSLGDIFKPGTPPGAKLQLAWLTPCHGKLEEMAVSIVREGEGANDGVMMYFDKVDWTQIDWAKTLDKKQCIRVWLNFAYTLPKGVEALSR